MKRRTFNVYVNTGGPIIHLHANALVEGAAMLCGRRVRPGWLWFSRSGGWKRPAPLCKQCVSALSISAKNRKGR